MSIDTSEWSDSSCGSNCAVCVSGIVSCISVFGPALAFTLGGLFSRKYLTLEGNSRFFSIISFFVSVPPPFFFFFFFLVRSFVGLFLLFSSSLNLEGFDMAGEDAHAFTAE